MRMWLPHPQTVALHMTDRMTACIALTNWLRDALIRDTLQCTANRSGSKLSKTATCPSVSKQVCDYISVGASVCGWVGGWVGGRQGPGEGGGL